MMSDVNLKAVNGRGLRGLKSIDPDKPLRSPVLVGREQALETVDRALEFVRGGRSRVLLLSGEAGIGKTRLASEVKKKALSRGFLQLQGTCYEPDRVLPYALVLDLVRSIATPAWVEELTRESGDIPDQSARLLSGLADLRDELTPQLAIEREQEKRRLFQTLKDIFLQILTTEALALIVEDVHWSDETSLEFLLYLSRAAASSPFLLVLTFRSDEARAGLNHFLTLLEREQYLTELTLSRLDRNQVAKMVRAILDPNRSVREDFLEAVYRLTDGNPFFIEEMLKSLFEAGEIFFEDGVWGRIPLEDLHIPRTIQDAVRRRTEHLSEKGSRILTFAAVAGPRFDFGLLQEVARMNEAELLPVMKELRGAQLVVEETSDKYAFRHALTREAVYATLLLRERKNYHRSIAETMERIYAGEIDSRLAELAYHFYQATAWEKALEYSSRAGERAQRMFAPREAIEHFSRALEAANHLSLPWPTGLLRARGQAFETIGEFERSREDLERALRISKEANDRTVEWQSLIDLGFLWASKDYRQAGEYFRIALDRARGLGDGNTLAHSLNRLGNWQVNTGDVDGGLRLHREALEIFRSQQNDAGMAQTFDLLGMADNLAGDIPGGAQDMDRAIELFRRLGDARGLASSLGTRYTLTSMEETVFSAQGNLADVERNITEALRLARQIGWTAGQAFIEFTSGSTFAVFGDFGKALAHARSAVKIAAEIGHQQWICGAYTHLGQVYVQMVQPALAIDALETSRPMAFKLSSSWWIGYSTAYLALAYLLRGDPLRAEAVLDEVMPSTRKPKDAVERMLSWAWGETMLRRGEPRKALRIAEQLIESVPDRGKGSGMRSRAKEPIPTLLKLKGEAHLALNLFAEAERGLEAARRGAIDRGVPPLLWQIYALRGNLNRLQKRREQAEREFSLARGIIRDLGATLEDEQMREDYVQNALSRLPAEKLVTPRRAAKREFGGLTDREREVASLVAAGRSNREIAAALTVSDRTVTTHVSNILSKLGFSSRAQIAAWAAEKRLT